MASKSPVGEMASSRRLSVWARLASEITALLALTVCGLLLFFGKTFESGFEIHPGDLGDWRYNNIIAEHWFLVLKGQAEWRSPIFFFPVKNTLGYSDALFLYTPFYIPFRFFGVESSLAFVYCFMSIITFGFITCHWFMSRVLSFPRVISLGASFAFAFSNMAAIRYPHAQLYAVSFLPVLFAVGARFASSVFNRQPSILHGVGFGTGLAALLYTGFYIGYFVLLFLFFFIPIFAMVSALGSWPMAAQMLRALWNARTAVLATVVSFVIALTPFLLTYLPMYREVGARDWNSVKCMLPLAHDFINVDGNSMWSWIGPSSSTDDPCPYPHELTFGLPLVTLSVFTLSLIWIMRARCRTRDTHVSAVRAGGVEYAPDFPVRLVLALGLSVLACWFMMLRLDMAPWYLVHNFLPGASALRAIFRFQFVLHFIVLLVICFSLSRIADQLPWRAARIASVFIISAIAIEQRNFNNPFFPGAETSRKLNLVPTPPPICRQFFVDPETVNDPTWYVGNLSAIIVAQRFGLPTLNGYSGSLPPGFHHPFFKDPLYLSNVASWAFGKNVLDGLCILDLDGHSWQDLRERLGEIRPALFGPNLLGLKLDDAMSAFLLFRAGFHPLEGTRAWTTGSAKLAFTIPIDGVNSVSISGHRGYPNQPLTIVVDGQRTIVDPSAFDFEIDLAVTQPVSSIEIISDSFAPVARGMGPDPRQLGVVLKSVILHK